MVQGEDTLDARYITLPGVDGDIADDQNPSSPSRSTAIP